MPINVIPNLGTFSLSISAFSGQGWQTDFGRFEDVFITKI